MPYRIEHATNIQASAEIVWQHVTEVDIASFRHPAYFTLLGIPKPLRAEVTQPGVGAGAWRFLITAVPSAKKSPPGSLTRNMTLPSAPIPVSA